MPGEDNGFWVLKGEYLSKDELLDIDDDAELLRLIKQRLYQDIWNEMREYDEREPPFIEVDSPFVTVARRAEVHQTQSVDTARLAVRENGFDVYLNEDMWPAKKRTKLAHELGHTYLYDLDRDPIRPRGDWNPEFDALGDDENEMWRTYEGFAWEVGGQLVAPSAALEKHVASSPSIQAFRRAAEEKFAVTKLTMIKRLYWHTFDWPTGANYWPDSMFVFYPDSKLADDLTRIPKGNREIFRGSRFPNLDMNEVWPELEPLVRRSESAPDQVVTPHYVNKYDSKFPISGTGENIYVEASYVPSHHRMYLLFCLEGSADSPEAVPLAHFTS